MTFDIVNCTTIKQIVENSDDSYAVIAPLKNITFDVIIVQNNLIHQL